jgi:dual specificity tyrosine-phosphorylation-regulated kinase 2/3/4
MYRYEIQKILGKGSFAQVVACKDHKLSTETNEVRVAIKITRNTELDHKFALGEAKLLQYLMEHDPRDEKNIVRLHEEFIFRDHHCFVFELLESGDLFEHLKATGFSGFRVEVIK